MFVDLLLLKYSYASHAVACGYTISRLCMQLQVFLGIED